MRSVIQWRKLKCYHLKNCYYYEDILCMEKERNIIAEKLTGMWQIAESNIGKYMLIKACWTPDLQIAMEHANCENDDVVLHGTAEKRYSHITLDATNNEGEIFVLVMQEVSTREAQTQLEIMKEIMGNISPYYKKDMTIFSVVKKLGYCNTQKKFNKLFIKYRHTILLKMRSDSETLASNEQKSLLNHNVFVTFIALSF